MTERTVIIGCDPAGDSHDFTAASVIVGKKMHVIIIDDHDPIMGESLRKALLEEAARMAMGDFSELEQRILGMQGQLPPFDYGWPDKLQAEEPIPKHNIHPKAKAKLPFYHQRRRF